MDVVKRSVLEGPVVCTVFQFAEWGKVSVLGTEKRAGIDLQLQIRRHPCRLGGRDVGAGHFGGRELVREIASGGI